MAIQDLTASLDLKQNLNIYATCKQFDSLNLILSIFDNSLQADLSNYDVRLRAMKADKVPLIQYHVGITINGNLVNIEADEQLTTTAGKTPIELQFINKSTGKKKATFNLILVVFPSTLEVDRTISKATYTLLEELEDKLDQASDFFENIDEAIEANINLINSTDTANETKEALDNSNTTALDTKSALDTSNTNAINTKNELDALNTTANDTKDDLNVVNQTGQTLLNSLEEFEQEHADVTDISNQLANVNIQLSEIAISVEKFFVAPMADYSTAIQNAINYIKSNSQYGTLLFEGKTYSINSAITYCSNITFKGKYGKTFITSSNLLSYAFVNPSDEDVENIKFKDIGFLGGVSESGTFPRVRTSRAVSSSIKRAIQATSSNNPANTTAKKVTNIFIESCIFKNLEDLPLYLDGVYGETRVILNEFSNNVDVGFIYCESVTFNNNNIEKSSDNGVSISRGCKKVICTGNKVKLCAYAGIWISGWNNTTTGEIGLGADELVCTYNIISQCGYFGLQFTDAPKNGIISHNIITKITRGTYDNKNDFRGIGIKISSFPETDYTLLGISVYSENLIISDNAIRECERGGIEARGVKYVKIHDNTMIDIGTQYLSDGVTAIANTARDQNFGVRLYIASYYIDVANNKVADTRGTQVTKYPYICENDSSNVTSYCKFKNNESFGCYQKLTAGFIQDSSNTNVLENFIQAIQNGSFLSSVSADTDGYRRLGFVKRSGELPAIIIGTGTPLNIIAASTQNIDDSTATYTTVGTIDNNGKMTLASGLKLSDGSWGTGKHIELGSYHVWVDTNGTARIKNSTPTSATDGNQISKIVSVPSTSASTGTVGDIAYDTNYLYICTATNVWKRIGLSTW